MPGLTGMCAHTQCSFLLCAPFRGADAAGIAPAESSHGIWCWLTESNRRHPAYKVGALPAELNQQSGSGILPAGVDVSCSTFLPKSPDRIAGIKKPRRDAEANFTNWYVTIIFMPPLIVKAAYQSRLKYDAFNLLLQYSAAKMSIFVPNVFLLRRVMRLDPTEQILQAYPPSAS